MRSRHIASFAVVLITAPGCYCSHRADRFTYGNDADPDSGEVQSGDSGRVDTGVDGGPNTAMDGSLDSGTDGGVMFDVYAVSAGGMHTCIRRSTGAVLCWGANDFGQLGIGSSISPQLDPVEIVGLSDATDVNTGVRHTCAVRAGLGQVLCWGRNAQGEVGDGTTDVRISPVAVDGLPNDVVQVQAGSQHTCARTSGGLVFCWGDNNGGQLGDQTSSDSLIPVNAFGIDDAVQLTVGDRHSCIRRATGALRCWGTNSSGQIGDGTSTISRNEPTPVMGLAGADEIVAGGSHTCARQAGRIYCWGGNGAGQIGDGTTDMRTTPTEISGLDDIAQLALGAVHTCVRRNAGDVLCWGSNSQGQLGDGTITDRSTPTAVVGLPSAATHISAGSNHTCAIVENGALYCWGQGDSGQLGNGSTEQSSVPVSVAGL